MTRQKVRQRVAQNGGGIEEFAVDAFKGSDQRLNGERQAVKNGGEHETFEGEG